MELITNVKSLPLSSLFRFEHMRCSILVNVLTFQKNQQLATQLVDLMIDHRMQQGDGIEQLEGFGATVGQLIALMDPSTLAACMA